MSGPARRPAGRFLLVAAFLSTLPGAPLPWLLGTAAATSPASGAPPAGRDLAAARAAVAQRAAAAGAAANRVAAAAARLSRLEARAETLIERYDGAMVASHTAASAFNDAQARLAAAMRAQAARQAAVGQLASEAYQTDGALGPMSAMVGGPAGGGPGGADPLQAYADRAGVLGVLAEHDAEVLAASKASRLVAQVFRGEARTAFKARQAMARQAAALKEAALEAVARQQQVLAETRTARRRLGRELAAARARERSLARAVAGAPSGSGGAAAGAAGSGAAGSGAAGSGGAGSGAAGSPTGGPASGGQPGSPAGGAAGGAGNGRGTAGAPGWAASSGAPASAGDVAANWALGQLGKPYVWAAAGPDAFDCSGLAMRAWQQAGVQLDHWTGTQWTSGPHVPLGQLRRGDLVFFAGNTADPATIHHVGIYIGHNMMVDAPYTGVDVRIESIYEPGLIGATRPAGG